MGKPLIHAFHRNYEYPIILGKVAQPQGRVIKTTMCHPYIPTSRATLRNAGVANHWWRCGSVLSSHALLVSTGTVTLENSVAFSGKIEIEHSSPTHIP